MTRPLRGTHNRTGRPKDLDRYYVSYTVTGHPDGISAEELLALGGEVGGAHGLIIFSVMYNPGGRISVYICNESHDQKDMEATELFEILVAAMAPLVDQLPPGPQKNLASLIADTVEITKIEHPANNPNKNEN